MMAIVECGHIRVGIIIEGGLSIGVIHSASDARSAILKSVISEGEMAQGVRIREREDAMAEGLRSIEITEGVACNFTSFLDDIVDGE